MERNATDRLSDEIYVECGCCGHWHRETFIGDCRNDAERFTTTQLEEKFGQRFWDELAWSLEDERHDR